MKFPSPPFPIQLSAVLLALPLLFGFIKGAEAVPPKSNAKSPVKAFSLTTDDRLILETTLAFFSSRENIYTFKSSSTLNTIVLNSMTDSSRWYLDSARMAGEMERSTPPFSQEIITDLQARNSKSHSLKSLEPFDDKIEPDDFSKYRNDQYFWRDLKKAHPQAKSYISLYLPGYSKDHRQALVRFSFGPTMHGAAATLTLTKENQRWRITWFNHRIDI